MAFHRRQQISSRNAGIMKRRNSSFPSSTRTAITNELANKIHMNPYHNRFNALSNLEMDFEEKTTQEENKKSKPPPFVVDKIHSLTKLRAYLGDNYTYKNVSIGTKIFSPNFEMYELCKTKLLENKITEYHSYASKDDRIFNVFLYGLPKMSEDAIMNELKAQNVIPTSVTITNSEYNTLDDSVYKVQFKRNEFNPANLNKIRTINRIVIRWKKFKPKRSGNPTQCWKCMMYGHGGAHCNRTAACMNCGESHLSKDCPFTQNQKVPAVFKCFNCVKHKRDRTDHSANDVNCPFRQLYIKSRTNVTSNHRNRISRTGNYIFEESGFPKLDTSHTPTNFQSSRVSYADQLRFSKRDEPSSNLFDSEELFKIFTQAIGELSACKNKWEQMNVIMSLLKYVIP